MERSDLVTHTSKCMTAFNDCLAISSVLKDNFRHRIEDQRGLFNIWATNANIFTRSRASLEYRLREAPRVKALTQDLLNSIFQTTCCFTKHLSSTERELGPTTTLDPNAIPEFLDNTKPFIQVCIDSIASDIKLLQHMLKAVRYSSISREIKDAASTTQIENARLFKVQIEYLVRDRFPDAQENIVERLVLSMVIRRNRLLYRKRRFQDRGIKLTRITERPEPVMQSEKPSKLTTPSMGASTQQPAPNVYTDAKSVHSNIRTATAVDQERYFRYSTPSTVANPHAKVVKTSNFQYPPIPKSSQGRGLLCPYCWLHLTDAETSTQASWITHLEGDLDQFVCLYETCDLGAESMLFERRSEWIGHMRSCHATRWHCKACQKPVKPYLEKLELESHIRKSHTAAFKTDNDLAVLVESCAVKPGRIFESCPLCGITGELQGDMDGHVADHLKGLALTTFCQYSRTIEVDEERDSDSNRCENDQHATRTTIKELLSLGSNSSRKGWTPPSSEDLKHNPLSTEQFGDLGTSDERLDDRRLSNEVDRLSNVSKNFEMRQLQWAVILSKVSEDRSTRSDNMVEPTQDSFRSTIEEGTILHVKSNSGWLDEEQRKLLSAMTNDTLPHFHVPSAPVPQDRSDFHVAILCALPIEAESVLSVFDIYWEDQDKQYGSARGDQNAYTTGVIGKYNVVLVHIPIIGSNRVAFAAAGLRSSFRGIKLALVVGTCGVVPVHPVTEQEIVLGDVVIGTEVVQYAFGPQYPSEFRREKAVGDSFSRANLEIQAFTSMLSTSQGRQRFSRKLQQLVQSEEFQTTIPTAAHPGVVYDHLYEASYLHRHRSDTTCDKCLDDVGTCSRNCDELDCEDDKLVIRHRHKLEEGQLLERVNHAPLVHLGRFASANTVMKSGLHRDRLSAAEDVTAFEMEGAGEWEWEQYPTIVIKAACDYADSHKNKKWQGYAAAMAAGCLKVFLKEWTISEPPSGQVHSFEPVWHVPFDLMPGFVGREEELHQLEQKLFEPHGSRIVALLGLGGVGKSRLVLELVFRIKSQFPKYLILWVQASEQSTFENDMLEIGRKLEIPGIEDKRADVKTLVSQRLSNSEHQWILILDNADDIALWGRHSNPDSTQTSLVEHLPRTTTGLILITTRSGQVANFLAENEVVNLSTLPPNKAAEMFIQRLYKADLAADRDALSILLNQLAYLPLALVQVASWVNMTGQTIRTYVDLIAKSEINMLRLLSEDFADRSRYHDAKNPVATTWLISFEDIKTHYPLAAEFLSHMACFHEKAIPQSLLLDDSSEVDDMDITDAIGVLTGYSFVTKQMNGNDSSAAVEEMFDMHRLVQLAVRNWLKMKGTISHYMRASTLRLVQLIPLQQHEYKNFWTMYLPHARRLCEDSEGEDFPERYELLQKMGLWFMVDGAYDEAVKAHDMVLNWRKNSGVLDQRTFDAYHNLGEALIQKGDFSSAERCLQQGFIWQKQLLGTDHPDTLASMNNLARVLGDQGKYSEAEEMYRQVVEIIRRVLGTEHPSTLTSMNNLAGVLGGQGKYSEAEEMYRQVVEVMRRVLGTEHPSTLTSMNNLAGVLGDQGKYSEAEEMYHQVVEVRRRVLGTQHPDTLTSMDNLTRVLSGQGKLIKAKRI